MILDAYVSLPVYKNGLGRVASMADGKIKLGNLVFDLKQNYMKMLSVNSTAKQREAGMNLYKSIMKTFEEEGYPISIPYYADVFAAARNKKTNRNYNHALNFLYHANFLELQKQIYSLKETFADEEMSNFFDNYITYANEDKFVYLYILYENYYYNTKIESII